MQRTKRSSYTVRQEWSDVGQASSIGEIARSIPKSGLTILHLLGVHGPMHPYRINKLSKYPYSMTHSVINRLLDLQLIEVVSEEDFERTGQKKRLYNLNLLGLLVTLWSFNMTSLLVPNKSETKEARPSIRKEESEHLTAENSLRYFLGRKSVITGQSIDRDLDCIAKNWAHWIPFGRWEFFAKNGVLDIAKLNILAGSDQELPDPLGYLQREQDLYEVLDENGEFMRRVVEDFVMMRLDDAPDYSSTSYSTDVLSFWHLQDFLRFLDESDACKKWFSTIVLDEDCLSILKTALQIKFWRLERLKEFIEQICGQELSELERNRL